MKSGRPVKIIKEKLEARIQVLEILMLIFAVVVGIGVTGEVLRPSSGFGRFTAIGGRWRSRARLRDLCAQLPAPDHPGY